MKSETSPRWGTLFLLVSDLEKLVSPISVPILTVVILYKFVQHMHLNLTFIRIKFLQQDY